MTKAAVLCGDGTPGAAGAVPATELRVGKGHGRPRSCAQSAEGSAGARVRLQGGGRGWGEQTGGTGGGCDLGVAAWGDCSLTGAVPCSVAIPGWREKACAKVRFSGAVEVGW